MKQTLATEVGLLAIWDSKSLAYIDTLEDYKAIFVEDKTILELMQKGYAVVWGTGGDGYFEVTVRVNPEKDLTDEEEKMVEMKAEDYKLVVTSEVVIVGTPECVGTAEKKYLGKEIFPVEGAEAGNYLVSVYFLYDSRLESGELAEKDVHLDKTGYIVILKRVTDDYRFPPVTGLPQLG